MGRAGENHALAKRSEWFVEVDVIKTIAIIMVIACHLPNFFWGSYKDSPFFSYCNELGVGMFIFASGFLLSWKKDKFDSLNGTLLFFKKKMMRLFPLYWVALFLFFVYDPVHPDITVQTLPFYLAGMQIAVAPLFTNPVSHLWFVGLIFMLYLVYPLIVHRARCMKEVIRNALIIFAVLLTLKATLGVIDVRFFTLYFVFLFGIMARDWAPLTDAPAGKLVTIAVLAFIFVFSFHFAMLVGTISSPIVLGVPITFYALTDVLVICLSLGLFGLVRMGRERMPIWSVRFLGGCSFASYATYLFHPLILYKLSLEMSKRAIGWPYHDVLFVAAIPALFALGYVIQWLERRLTRKVLEAGRPGHAPGGA